MPNPTPSPGPPPVWWFISHLPDPVPVDSLPPDNYYRDLCVATMPIPLLGFDPYTGSVPFKTAEQGFKLAGEVIGAKPLFLTDAQQRWRNCMPMKNTPVNPLTAYKSDANYAFAWFTNVGNYNKPADIKDKLRKIYNNSDDNTRSFYSMFNSSLYCKSMLRPLYGLGDDMTAMAAATYHRSEAENCYDQYITQRITRPWHGFELAGSVLAKYLPFATPEPAGNAPYPPATEAENNAVKNLMGLYCQPLMAGDQSQQFYAGKLDFSQAGYAEVVSSNNPLINENEYHFSDNAASAWQSTLYSGSSFYAMALVGSSVALPFPFPTVDLPCLAEKNDANLPINVYPYSTPQDPNPPTKTPIPPTPPGVPPQTPPDGGEEPPTSSPEPAKGGCNNANAPKL